MRFEDLKSSDIFKCTRCGDCCKGYGGTVVNDAEIEAIAEFIDADSQRFVTDFCQMSGKKKVLRQGHNGYCLFWNGLCTIHPMKPKMCRAWPFIQSVLADVDNWNIMAGLCPGMRTDIPEKVVQACVEEELSKLRALHP